MTLVQKTSFTNGEKGGYHITCEGSSYRSSSSTDPCGLRIESFESKSWMSLTRRKKIENLLLSVPIALLLVWAAPYPKRTRRILSVEEINVKMPNPLSAEKSLSDSGKSWLFPSITHITALGLGMLLQKYLHR